MFVLALLFCVEVNPWESVSILTRLPRAVEVVVLKLASSPNAAANSFSVFNVPGALSTKEAISCWTNAVDAAVVSLSPLEAVATVTVLDVKSKVL